jgi:ubiquinol-cytochrome c reductase cytochrome c1 subunit
MMPPPFVEGIIEYKDGITPTMTKMSQDITAFLYWASYPNLEKRISLGNKIIFYLIILILLLFSLNKVIWNDINKK